MSKPKMLGAVKNTRDKKRDLRWERKNARIEVKRHDPTLARFFGSGADDGCLQAAVTAGIKRKNRTK